MDITTEKFSYCIGFILTDGNVYKNTIRVDIQRRDSKVLYFMKDIFGGDIVNYEKDNREYSRWTKNSKELVNELSYFHIVPNKSLIVRLPKTLRTIALLRGIWDGDGSWYIKKNNSFQTELCSASYLFLVDIVRILRGLGFTSKLTIQERNDPRRKNPLYRIQLYSKEARQLHSLLYNDKDVCLPRKRDIIKQWKKKDIYKNGAKIWTEEEVSLLSNAILNNIRRPHIYKLFPDRSKKSVDVKMSRLESKIKNENRTI